MRDKSDADQPPRIVVQFARVLAAKAKLDQVRQEDPVVAATLDVIQQHRGLAVNIGSGGVELEAARQGPTWNGPFKTATCAGKFGVSEGTWRNWAGGSNCPLGLHIKSAGKRRGWYFRTLPNRNEAQ